MAPARFQFATMPLLPLSDPHSGAAVLTTLRRGGIVALPTDTVYGLCGLPPAAPRLRALKGRDGSKPFQLLVADLTMAKTLAEISPLAEKIIAPHFPGALTIVVAARNQPQITLGLRAPKFPWLQEILRSLPTGLLATSANRAGEMPLASGAAIAAMFGAAVDLIIDGGEISGAASTVVSLLGAAIKILRPGAITLK
jgi:L-threonylcarbamoyladenylate synthase